MKKSLMIGLIITIPIIIFATNHFHTQASESTFKEPPFFGKSNSDNSDNYYPQITKKMPKPTLTQDAENFIFTFEYVAKELGNNFTFPNGDDTLCDSTIFEYCEMTIWVIFKESGSDHSSDDQLVAEAINGVATFAKEDVYNYLTPKVDPKVSIKADGMLEYKLLNQKIQQVIFEKDIWNWIFAT